MPDEGKVAHAWITRTAAIVGVVGALVAAGFSVATFLGGFATQEELAEVREHGSEPTRAHTVAIQQHEARLEAINAALAVVLERQQHLDAKIDWLIQVELVQSSRMRVSVPQPPRTPLPRAPVDIRAVSAE